MRSAPASSAARVLLVFALAALAACVSTTAHIDGERAEAQRVAAGRYAVRIAGASNSTVGAASCDSLVNVDGVRAAGGSRQGGSLRLANGVVLPTVEATPGFVSYLTDQARPAGAEVVVFGADAAAAGGVRTGTLVGIDGVGVRPAAVLDDGPRTTSWSDAVVVVDPPAGTVNECVVELEPGSADIADLLVLVEGPRPLAYGPLDRDSLPSAPAEVRRETLTPVRAGLAAGLPALLLSVVLWWSRRGDWALYSVLGFGPRSVGLIAATEWVAWVALPLVSGGAWGLLLVVDPGAEDGAVGAGATTVAVAVLATVPALGWIRAFTLRMSPKELLAGL